MQTLGQKNPNSDPSPNLIRWAAVQTLQQKKTSRMLRRSRVRWW